MQSRNKITAVMLAVVILFSGLNIGQLNIARAAGPTESFTVAGVRYEGDGCAYSEAVKTSWKIKKVTVNSVSQGSAMAEILDDYSFRIRFSGGSSYTLTGGATATYEGTVITDCTNDAAYIEVPINKYVTEIIDIYFDGQGTSPKSSWEISHPDGSSSIIRFKAENGRYIPHYWYKTVTNIQQSKIKNNTYNKTLINDDPLKWGGAGWDIVYKLDSINGTKKLGNTNVQGNPYWNAVKIYYDPSTPNYDFKITMRLDRWEFIPVIEYKFQSKQYDYSANVTVEYEDIAGPQAYFTAPAEVGVNETFTVVEDSRTPEGTNITGWAWEVSADGGGSWSSLSWGHGTFTHSFDTEGERLVRLKVENNIGQVSDWYQRSISVINNSPNQPPVSGFDIETPVYVGHEAWIRDRSGDPDGEIVDIDYDTDCPEYDFDIEDDGDGIVRFFVAGEYTVTQEVEDDRGAGVSSSRRVEVLPVPEADIEVSGRLRANRKVILSALQSVENPDDPIDHTGDSWTITPVDPPAGLEYRVVDSGTPGVIWLQSNKACEFRVDLAVRTRGGDTDDASKTIHIEPDTPPVVNVMVKPQAIRDPENGTKAIILPVCDTQVQEGDYISSRTWYYKYDTDNDGSFSDEAWIMFSSGNNPSPIFETAGRDDVGKYLFRLDVEENWRDEYIPAYVTADDFLTDNNLDIPEGDRTVEVLNIPPIFSFTPVRVQKADVLLMVPESDRQTVENKTVSFEATMRNGDIAAIDPEIEVDTFVSGTLSVTPLFNNVGHRYVQFQFRSASDTALVYEIRNSSSPYDRALVSRSFLDGRTIFEYSNQQYNYNVKNGYVYIADIATYTRRRVDAGTGDIVCTFDVGFSERYIYGASDYFVLSIGYRLFDNMTGALLYTPLNYKTHLFSGDVAYIADDNGVHAFDTSGNELYSVPLTSASLYQSFTEDEGNLYYKRQVSAELYVSSIRKSDGHINWTYTDPVEEFTVGTKTYTFRDRIDGYVAVSGDTVYVHRYSYEKHGKRDNPDYSCRSNIIGLDKTTGSRLFRDMLAEKIDVSKTYRLWQDPEIRTVDNYAFASVFSGYYDKFYGKKYDRAGNIKGVLQDDYAEGYGFSMMMLIPVMLILPGILQVTVM
ncbi:MAG: hypothetical protein HPY66_0975 [Firmicutes bacterium]|nr:hypothetical protein [Bacillota bacterium]